MRVEKYEKFVWKLKACRNKPIQPKVKLHCQFHFLKKIKKIDFEVTSVCHEGGELISTISWRRITPVNFQEFLRNGLFNCGEILMSGPVYRADHKLIKRKFEPIETFWGTSKWK